MKKPHAKPMLPRHMQSKPLDNLPQKRKHTTSLTSERCMVPKRDLLAGKTVLLPLLIQTLILSREQQLSIEVKCTYHVDNTRNKPQVETNIILYSSKF